MEGITAKCLGCERDVPLEDIRQHVHDFQEIEQHCGLCPAKFKRGDVLQQKSVCSEEEISCARGQQLIRKEKPINLKACPAPWGVLQLLKGQMVMLNVVNV
ncbi:hypothetical protein pdam_00022479 [Pocillopora damicornis]|uniref:TRAF-type domain-containing protein n=1 Tax=Pocillopora damicornis TaxID=46731 RepID=A0A3M6T7Y0_POCDA|nr:hypothetical protein pdam_00022479 [Pocillopora damicornis]